MMKPFDSAPDANMTAMTDVPSTSSSADVAPPVGVTPPQVLAQDAAKGRRGAAWRLLYWIMEDDPRAIVAISSLEDDRLVQHLLNFIAIGTWADKPFVIPRPLRSPHARTRLRTLFLPGAGIDPIRSERVLLAAMNDKRPAVRETTAHILGIFGSPTATPKLIETLQDPIPSVKMQAIKALGRVGDPEAVPALLNALHGADEQMGSQIFTSLVRLGHAAVPGLIEASKSNSPWMRWHCIRALGEIGDYRDLPVLTNALSDHDHSIAWMAAKGLVHFGRRSIAPVLHLLITTPMTRWLAETASYIFYTQYQRDNKLKPYLEPVVQSMRGVAYQVGTVNAAQKALSQLTADGLIEG